MLTVRLLWQMPIKHPYKFHGVWISQFGQIHGRGSHFVRRWQCSSQPKGAVTNPDALPRPCPALLVSSLHWDCAGRLSKRSCDGTYERFALRELSYQCNQNGLQVPSHAGCLFSWVCFIITLDLHYIIITGYQLIPIWLSDDKTTEPAQLLYHACL